MTLPAYNIAYGKPTATQHVDKAQADIRYAKDEMQRVMGILTGMMQRGVFAGQEAHLYTVAQAAMAHAGNTLFHANMALDCAKEAPER